MDPYSSPHSDVESSRFNNEEWEAQVQRNIVTLGSGKGHAGIINELRASGLDYETAKYESIAIFEEARKRLKKEQRLHRFIAWSFILIGIALPVLLFVAGFVSIFSAIPFILGMGLLFRLPNPKPLKFS